ncbi:S-adenosyl-L-methionine-dependent methyltransferase [Coemansia reversa NRRL 1564]|uniref:S-adenosyl-L-methionine-dependent methyltransferase n=1 Tax=Coemansia reversa (strain ATCC 12441 / NRRL 1564) TaxID=763665 RepID=A0A2G5B9W9_COERN|nr:S-adenosyl-L-methionine-dependent methyltransferase [Coemansia reversa NRRL 1564]|eukprot:PIA15527.1 S-adenosyl-L-methionine-dependent methyltransferase [Coemansia reversa NRRL 1564]
MEMTKWQFRNPYHDPRQDTERTFVFGPHTLKIKQQHWDKVDLHHNTGYIVWDGAYLLARFIFERAEIQGKRCLELGAGNGLVSIVAHYRGAKNVAATDMSEYLNFLRYNIAQNVSSEQQSSIDVYELLWGTTTNINPVDVVLGSEILYLSEQHEGLIKTLQQLMHAQSVAYFIYKERRLNEHQFTQMANSNGFTVREIPKSALDAEFADEPYHLLKVTKKN